MYSQLSDLIACGFKDRELDIEPAVRGEIAGLTLHSSHQALAQSLSIH